jgi:hypothetical protein
MNIWIVLICALALGISVVLVVVPSRASASRKRATGSLGLVLLLTGIVVYQYQVHELQKRKSIQQWQSAKNELNQLHQNIETLKLELHQSSEMDFPSMLQQLEEFSDYLAHQGRTDFSLDELRALNFKLNSLQAQTSTTERNEPNQKAETERYRTEKFRLTERGLKIGAMPTTKKTPSTLAADDASTGPPEDDPNHSYSSEYRVLSAEVQLAGQNKVVPLLSKSDRPLSLFDGDVVEYTNNCDLAIPNTSIDGGVYAGISKRGIKPIREFTLKTAFEKHVLQGDSGRVTIRAPRDKALDVVISNPMRYKNCQITLVVATPRAMLIAQ